MRIDVLGDVWHRSKKALTLLLRSKATTNWRKEGSGNKIFGENRHAAYNHKGVLSDPKYREGRGGLDLGIGGKGGDAGEPGGDDPHRPFHQLSPAVARLKWA